MSSTVNKFHSAERLIHSAIRMCNAGEDVLAVYVVAASGLNVLRNLITNSGDDHDEQIFKQGAFELARAKLNGEPVAVDLNQEARLAVDHIAEGIKAGAVRCSDDIIVTLTKDDRKNLHNFYAKPHNFLKHADNDPLDTIDPETLDYHGAIISALSAIGILNPGRPTPDLVTSYLKHHGVL